MKKIRLSLLAFAMALALFACGEKPDRPQGGDLGDAEGIWEKVELYNTYERLIRYLENGYDNDGVMEYTYDTNDEFGRPVSAQLTEQNSRGESDYASQVLTYMYQDLYFFQ